MHLIALFAVLAAAADPTPEERLAFVAGAHTRAAKDQEVRASGESAQAIDEENTAWLKERVALWGWPDAARFGEQASSDAWLLLQHSRDHQFQRDGLALIEPLLDTGLVKKSQYALLYDRTRVFAGEPQRYGSQFQPDEKGVFRPCPIEDPEHLEERRAAMELPTMKVYRKRLASMGPEPVKLDPLPACE